MILLISVLYHESCAYLQRTQRSEAYKRYSLHTVEALQGAPGPVKDAIVLGMLSQQSPGTYELEDMTGIDFCFSQVEVSMSLSGLLCEHDNALLTVVQHMAAHFSQHFAMCWT